MAPESSPLPKDVAGSRAEGVPAEEQDGGCERECGANGAAGARPRQERDDGHPKENERNEVREQKEQRDPAEREGRAERRALQIGCHEGEREEEDRDPEHVREEPQNPHRVVEERNHEERRAWVAPGRAQEAPQGEWCPREVPDHQHDVREAHAEQVREEVGEDVVRHVRRLPKAHCEVVIERERGIVEAVEDADRREVVG